MIISTAPVLPFPTFKWRWASVAPTEGLNDPKVFLGALRAFRKFEGSAPSSGALLAELRMVQTQTQASVDLVRTVDRNLIRNSGQYWKAFGLLEESDPVIILTPFGRSVAAGGVTMAEFAATAVATMELPNTKVQADHAAWTRHGIRFKPLELLLGILAKLKLHPSDQGYLTKSELVEIIVPISAISTNVDDFADTVLAHRSGNLSIIGWPRCAQRANDHRMAAEFLLFLEHYGYCSRQRTSNQWTDKYYLALDDAVVIKTILSTVLPLDLTQAAKVIANTGVADFVERQRVMRAVLNRPNQAKFRRDVLASSGCECVVTGTQLDAALEAAHIIPVMENGSDHLGNGFCMRSDIHTLFDNGHLRISPTGMLQLSNSAKGDPVYQKLPANILIPSYVTIKNLEWRWSYS